MRLAVRYSALLVSAAFLSACGGGGDDAGPCGGSGNLSVSLAYEVNGQVVDPSLISLRVGAPVMAIPKAVGLPAACNTAARWTFRQTSTRVPEGLSFDTVTGVVSGTPAATGFLTLTMGLRVEGYVFNVEERVTFGISAAP